MSNSSAANNRTAPEAGGRFGLPVVVGVGVVVVVAIAAFSFGVLGPKSGTPTSPGTEELSSARLEAAVRDLDRLEPGWRFQELERDRQPVRDEENSAPVVRKAARLIPEDWPAARFDRLRKELRSDKPSGVVSLREELETLAGALAEARKLATLPRGRHPVAWDETNPLATPLPHIADVQMVADLLALDCEWRAHQNDIDGVLTSLRAAFNAGRSLGDEPMLQSQIVRPGVHYLAVQALEQALARRRLPEAGLAQVQRLLEEEAAEPILLTAVRGDRAGLHALMLALEKGEIVPAALAPVVEGAGRGSRTDAVRTILADPALRNEVSLRSAHAWLLDYTTRHVAICRLPLHEQPARVKELVATAGNAPPAARALLFPPAAELTLTFQRGQALLRSAAAAVAAERYRLARGDWPAALADLVPQYLAAVPTDPFDGKPLRLARHEQGIAIYAVGGDGRDDGGQFDELNTYRDGTDLGFRLWRAGRDR